MTLRACLIMTGLLVAQPTFAAETAVPGAAPAANPAVEPPPPPPPKPGEWEITFVDPLRRGNDQKYTHCFKAGEPPQHVLPPSKGNNQKFPCTVHRGHKPKTNIVTLNASCKNEMGTITETGSAAYTEEAYEGQVTATVSVPQMVAAGMPPIRNTIPIRGKRLGDCK